MHTLYILNEGIFLTCFFLNFHVQVQALGLASEYRNPNGDLKTFVQQMASVVFCPLTFVRTAWLL